MSPFREVAAIAHFDLPIVLLLSSAGKIQPRTRRIPGDIKRGFGVGDGQSRPRSRHFNSSRRPTHAEVIAHPSVTERQHRGRGKTNHARRVVVVDTAAVRKSDNFALWWRLLGL